MSFVQTFLPLYFFFIHRYWYPYPTIFSSVNFMSAHFSFLFFSLCYFWSFLSTHIFFCAHLLAKHFFALRLEKIIELAPETDVRIIMSFSGTSFRARLRSCSVLMIVSWCQCLFSQLWLEMARITGRNGIWDEARAILISYKTIREHMGSQQGQWTLLRW